MPFRLPEFRPRVPFAGIAIGAILGIFAADAWPVHARWPITATALLGLYLWKRPPSPRLTLAFVAIAFFALPPLRHHGSGARLLGDEFAAHPQVVTVRGLVWSEPEKPKTWSRNTTCH